MLRYNLESDGFRVLVAGNGEEGLLLTEEQGPDLIVLDWMMPELPGIELCRKLCAPNRGEKFPSSCSPHVVKNATVSRG